MEPSSTTALTTTPKSLSMCSHEGQLGLYPGEANIMRRVPCAQCQHIQAPREYLLSESHAMWKHQLSTVDCFSPSCANAGPTYAEFWSPYLVFTRYNLEPTSSSERLTDLHGP